MVLELWRFGMMSKTDKKIAFFGKDPGSVNVLTPVLLKLRVNYSCFVYAYKHGKDQFKRFGVDSVHISHETDVTLCLTDEFKKNAFDLVVTGTGIENFERSIWSFAKENKILSCAIIDSWVNLSERFIDFDKRFILPDYIVCIDDYSKKILIHSGIHSEKIKVFGNPYFEFLLKTYQESKDLSSSSNIKILFASQPISCYFPINSEKSIGYDEFSVLEDIAGILQKIQENYNLELDLFVKAHPKDDKQKLFALIDLLNLREMINVSVFSDSLSFYQYVNNFDVVIGMNSMLLVESYLFKVPVINYEPNKKKNERFVLERLDYIDCITSKDMLYNEVIRVLIDKNFRFFDLGYENAVEKICDFLEGLL